MSNMKVFVEWERSSVFAGEDVNCKITFTNAVPSLRRPRSSSPGAAQIHNDGSGRERWFSNPPSHRESNKSSQKATPGRKESVKVFEQRRRPTVQRAVSTATVANLSTGTANGPRKHQRSVSIVSIGSVNVEGNDTPDSRGIYSPETRRQLSQHGRAASFHGVSAKAGSLEKPSINSLRNDRTLRLSNTSPITPPFNHSRVNSVEHKGVGVELPVNGTSLPRSPKPPPRDANLLPLSFRYAQSPPPKDIPHSFSIPFRPKVPIPAVGVSPEKLQESTSENYVNRNAIKILSPVSMNGTPRSSVDFYSASNHSAETLASEYVAPIVNHQSSQPKHGRQSSYLTPILSRSRPPETLMMGYVQLMGSFTLDGSLVNLAPFESIKRRGVIGGQGGGGVVGIVNAKRESGLLGGFSWGNIGESLGGLLGGTEPSSIREMKGIASTRSVPIISTPQSILFVDLRLSPGESRSYKYNFTLPKGIPPTHKGRAIKVTYNLVIGTQRAQANAQQHSVRHVDIPFRVLPGVNGQGTVLGHDLMNPYIILQCDGCTSSISDHTKTPTSPFKAEETLSSRDVPSELSSYVEGLLNRPRQNSHLGLLSPTDSISRMLPSSIYGSTVKEIIDFAILKGNSLTSSMVSANRFQIQKTGEQIAVILLARSAYRLGETISAVVDFQDAQVPCYSVHVSLETSEVVDPTIALRSSASIRRATRKIYAAKFEHTVCAQRTTFLSTIPINSTPEFATSGVSLEWKLNFEFVTALAPDLEDTREGLMEEVLGDERGTTYAAVERLPCENFDVSVPIRVYGRSLGSEDRMVVGGFPI